MSNVEIVPVGNKRIALPAVQLSSPPPTRIYISGHEYLIQAPRVALPPIVNVIKFILNWVGPAGRLAKNILYAQLGTGGTASTSDTATLQQSADMLLTGLGASSAAGSWSSAWQVQSITAKDAGGTSATATSLGAAYPGGVTGGSLPPQVAQVVSWSIASSYRGGKPRMYLPGVPFTATTPAGGSQLDPTFCAGTDTAFTAWMTYVNGHPILGTPLTLGTVSYHHAHTIRPTPLFVKYLAVRVHERLDSQRRRSGKESSFPATP